MTDLWTDGTEDLVAVGLCAPETQPWERLTHKQQAQFRTYARRALTALADAGLLVTPGQLAVIDAAVKWREYHGSSGRDALGFPAHACTDELALGAAVDAYRQQGDPEPADNADEHEPPAYWEGEPGA